MKKFKRAEPATSRASWRATSILSSRQDQECRACALAFPWAVGRSPVHAGMAPRPSVGGEPGRPWQLQQATCLTPHCKETIFFYTRLVFPINLPPLGLGLFRLLCSPLYIQGASIRLTFDPSFTYNSKLYVNKVCLN